MNAIGNLELTGAYAEALSKLGCELENVACQVRLFDMICFQFNVIPPYNIFLLTFVYGEHDVKLLFHVRDSFETFEYCWLIGLGVIVWMPYPLRVLQVERKIRCF